MQVAACTANEVFSGAQRRADQIAASLSLDSGFKSVDLEQPRHPTPKSVHRRRNSVTH